MSVRLALAFLVVGLIVGAVVGGFFGSSLSRGRGPATASPSPGVTVAPEDMLPFHLKICPTPDCTGGPPLKLPDHVKKHGGDDKDIPSNMSVNGGGDEQDSSQPISLKGAAPAPAFAITIPEDPKYNFPRPRKQTLYIDSQTTAGTGGNKKSYFIITCYNTDPRAICTPPPTATPTPTPAPHTP